MLLLPSKMEASFMQSSFRSSAYWSTALVDPVLIIVVIDKPMGVAASKIFSQSSLNGRVELMFDQVCMICLPVGCGLTQSCIVYYMTGC